MKLGKLPIFGFTTMIAVVVIYLIYNFIFFWGSQDKESLIFCESNINFNLSDGVSAGPIINGVLYLNFKDDGSGLIELSGTVKWLGVIYPVSKQVNIKHDLKRSKMDDLVTIESVSVHSFEHDRAPAGIVEKYLIGAPSLPARIVNIKREHENGYVISNVNSPLMICIDR